MTLRTTRLALVAAALTVSACNDRVEPMSGPLPHIETASRAAPGSAEGQRTFIVTLEPRASAAEVARDHGLVPTHVYSRVMDGFAASMSEVARSGLLRDARVVRVDPDQTYTTAGTQSGATWGLDRVDQRSGLDGSYAYDRTGRGVTVYVVDTGIRRTHVDFGGRASIGFDAFGGDGTDCRGHGTHVAGTVGGARWGVAKEASLVAVRVLDCTGSGTSSTLLAGLDWVVAHAARPAVVNLSLGGSADQVVDDGIRRVVAAGITVVAAAGNSYKDACGYSPARVPEALTIGATTETDQKSIFSNFGDCVDWFAPGSAITSAGFTSDTSIALMSGTSMASPHTAGAAALYLEAYPNATPAEVAVGLASWLTRGIVTSAMTTNNHLLFTRGEGGTAPVNNPPGADFVPSCSELTCAFEDRSADVDGSVVQWQWTFGDGAESSERNPTHTYAAAGTFRVALTVTDDAGATARTYRDVALAPPSAPSDTIPAENLPPTASFLPSCLRLECEFRDASSDADGTLVRWSWQFGDGKSAVTNAGTDPVHVFAAGGEYRVTLEVTDDAGAVATAVKDVTVGVVLAARGSKQKGRHVIDLSWTGAETSQVDVYLDGAPLTTVSNSGAYTYRSPLRGQATYRFKVCEAGSTMCSLEQSVTM